MVGAPAMEGCNKRKVKNSAVRAPWVSAATQPADDSHARDQRATKHYWKENRDDCAHAIHTFSTETRLRSLDWQLTTLSRRSSATPACSATNDKGKEKKELTKGPFSSAWTKKNAPT